MVEQRLVPIQIAEMPLLSDKQREELLHLARFYLRDHKTPVTVSSLEKAMGVLGDAASRQIKKDGRTSFKPNERIRLLIKQGLEVRDEMREDAGQIIDLTLRYPGNHHGIIGPFCLPAGVFNGARTELRDYYLRPKIDDVQQLLYLYITRHPILKSFAERAFHSLEGALEEVTLDRFPEVSDWAKIVRNSIVSFLFRGSLSPNITNQDIKDFLQRSKASPLFLSDEAKELYLESLGLQSDEEKSFASALFDQTRTAFSKLSIPEDEDPLMATQFHTHLSRDFLILHPALEERRIIIDPSRVDDESPSLWNNASIISGVAVPRTEILLQAAQQARAKGFTSEEKRLMSGVKLWRWYRQERITHGERIDSLEQQLEQRRKLFEQVSEPDIALPSEAYSIRFLVQQENLRKARAKARAATRVYNLIQENLGELEEARAYKETLRTQSGEDIPEVVAMPRRFFIRGLEVEVRSIQGRISALRAQLAIAEELLESDPLLYRTNFSFVNRLTKPDAEQILKKELVNLESSSHSQELRRNSIRRIREQYPEGRIRSFLSVVVPFRRFVDFWLTPASQIKDETELRTIAKSYRIQVVSHALSLLGREQELKAELREKESEIVRYKDDPNKEFPEDAVWSKAQVTEYIEDIDRSDPSKIELSSEELVSVIPEMRMFLANSLPAAIFPQVITTQEKLSQWITSVAEKTRVSILDAEKANKGIRNLNRRLEFLAQLARFVAHPLLPYPGDNEELARDRFLRIWRRRVAIAYGIYYQDKVKNESEEAQEIYEKSMREMFLESLSKQISETEEELGHLKAQNIEAEFAVRIQQLNLALVRK